jgi:class 3 adenylate cyclase/tetratricopeptide (TPR) repeat protein
VSEVPAKPSIDELLDRAVQAVNRGDRATADALAGQVLAVDHSNIDAEELLAAPVNSGEIRRLSMLFADLVDSTALSTRVDPEVYRTVVGRYREEVLRLVNHYEGHIGSTKGDGLFAVFGHPRAHENDAHRAVQAGLDITREIASLSDRVRRRFGFDIDVRVGIHRGLVYLDTVQDEVYGLGANLAARMCSLAEPGSVAVSAPIERVLRHQFEFAECAPRAVKGVDGPMIHYRVVAEREVARIPRGPLIGRESEYAFLQESWRRAVAGTLTTTGVVFCGEGGIGKTRLARAAIDLAEESGAPVLNLFGSPFHTDVGLRPVRRLIERRAGIGRGADPVERLRMLRDEVQRHGLDPAVVVPLLAPVLGIGPESGYQPATANAGRLYDQIAGAVKEYLLACIGRGPGLIVAEDIHWFDEDTVEIVAALLQERPGRFFVVVTGRKVPPLADEKQFELKPLNSNQSDALISALHPELTADARRAVQERCDGIPLYIEEVTTNLREGGADSDEPVEVPDTLYETLIARLGSSRTSLLVVETAALIGSVIDKRLLSSVIDIDPAEVDGLLSELTRARVLRQDGADSWRFHHELLREVAAELSPPTQRRRLHSLIADALVAAADGSPEWKLVALHYQSAERYDEAATAFQQAATNARQRGALTEARTHLTRALNNIEQMAPGPARDHHEIAIRLERGFLTSAAEGHSSPEAAAEFERCLQLIGSEPRDELYATLSGLWTHFATRGDLRRATQLVEALRSVDHMPEWYHVANDVVLGVLAVFRGELNTAGVILDAAATAVDRIGSPEIEGAWFSPNDPLAGAHTYAGFIRVLQADLAGAEAEFAKAEGRLAQLGFPHGPFTRCYTRSVELFARFQAGQLERAGELIDDISDRATRYGFDEWVMISDCNRSTLAATLSLVRGETDPAVLAEHVAALTGVVELWRALETKTFLACYDGTLAQLLLASGMVEQARERVDLALQMADETGMHFYDAELLRIRAHTHADSDARHTGLRAAIELARKQGATNFEIRAAADDFLLLGGIARQPLADALSRCPADQRWPVLARARALLE